ncbi:MAG: Gfo/Idh/MocA family oxidoreductase [Fuerstiella sp.]|nr:Gfo/Idh/MocA family oxidoreductase [Fuerstiella sp.]
MFTLDRRDFLKTTAVAGAAFTTPAFGRAGISANDRIGACVVGVRGRGGSHIKGWLNDPRTEVRAIVEVDEDVAAKRASEIETKQGIRPAIYTDMRKAFENDDIDIVSSATPNHWHALSAIWAMERGKDAYIEKPVSHNIAEGAAMIAAARKYGRMCQVGTQCRSRSAIRDAVQFIADGGIGECTFARGLCYKRRKAIDALGDYAIPSNVDYNFWCGPATYTDPKNTRKRFHYDWHWQRHYGNGDLGNQGPHQTDIARWGLGIDTHPSTILTYGGRLGYQAERNDPNYVDAGDTGNTEVSIYDYGDKCIVFETRGLGVNHSDDDEINRLFQKTEGNKIGVIFYGSEGYVVQQSYSRCVVFDRDLNPIEDKKFVGGGDHFGNFLDACESRNVEDLNGDVREGHLSGGISHLGNISYYMGEQNHVAADEISGALKDVVSQDDNEATLQRTLKHLQANGVDLEKYPLSLGPKLEFDPERELFTNNSAANQYLSREYRKGFECPSAENV